MSDQASLHRMNTWRRPQRTARVLRALLFFWLFGLAAAWANACVLQARFDAHHPSDRHHAAEAAQIRLAAGFTPAGIDHSDPAAESCLSFCDTGQSVIPKLTLQASADLDLAHMAFVGVALPWSAVAAAIHARRFAAPPPPGPPVAIRFLRLTL